MGPENAATVAMVAAHLVKRGCISGPRFRVVHVGPSRTPASDAWVVFERPSWAEAVTAHDAFEAARWWLRAERGDVDASDHITLPTDAAESARKAAARWEVEVDSYTSRGIEWRRAEAAGERAMEGALG
jgi:hypothetical protein